MKSIIEKELKAANLQNIEVTVTKIIQLFETKNSRHSVMIVGLSGSGKSVTWKILRNTLTRLKKENKGSYQAVKVQIGENEGRRCVKHNFEVYSHSSTNMPFFSFFWGGELSRKKWG